MPVMPGVTVHPRLADRSCYHKYEIEPGFFTPGQVFEMHPKTCLDELGVPASLQGLRALDIGAWDGPFTFELERRGATVTALDIQDPDVTVFNAVKAIKNSSATYVRGSVYDATPETLGKFDVVLFVGVYYHLKSPVVALHNIRKLLVDNGSFFIEGGATTDYLAEQLTKSLGLSKGSLTALAETLDRLPLSYFDTEQRIYGDWSNWWFPTTRCLEVMLADSGFRQVQLALKRNAFYNYSHRRLMGSAVADPAKQDPAAQHHEHFVAVEDLASDRLARSGDRGRLAWLPPGLRDRARRLRRGVRKHLNF
jgi:SAM-dependent methyltransferase